MHETFDEEDGISGSGSDLHHAILMRVVEPDVVGTGVIGSVAAGQAGKAAVARMHIGELDGDIGESTVHSPVAIEISAGTVVGLGAFVKPEPFGTLVHQNGAHRFQPESGTQ